MPRINMVFDLDLFLPDNIASVFSYVLWPCNFRGPSRRKQGQTFTLTMPTAASVANVIVSAHSAPISVREGAYILRQPVSSRGHWSQGQRLYRKWCKELTIQDGFLRFSIYRCSNMANFLRGGICAAALSCVMIPDLRAVKQSAGIQITKPKQIVWSLSEELVICFTFII